MQNAKDSFYLALRSRLAELNPARQVTIAGVQRPGVLVAENETFNTLMPTDVFVLRWEGTAVNPNLPAALESQVCTIAYCTSGVAANGFTDRGRAMTEMDAELAAMLVPPQTQKMSVGSQMTVPFATEVFWSAGVFGDVTISGTRLTREVKVQVFSLQETLANGGLER